MNVKGRNPTNNQITTIEHVVPNEEELKIAPQKSYKCELCDYTVKTKSNLRAHRVKTHRIIERDEDIAFLYRMKQNVQKIYHCPINGCKYQDVDKGFPKYSALRQHYIWVHGTRDHMCATCYRFFPSVTMLERHQQSCGQFHVCPKCGRRYSEMKYLKQHMKRMKHMVEKIAVDEPQLQQAMEIKSTKPMPQYREVEDRPMQDIEQIESNSIAHCNTAGEINQGNVTHSPAVNQFQTLQPIVLPVIVPVPMSNGSEKEHSTFTVDSSGISEAITMALRPVIERLSSESAASQRATKLHEHPEMADVGILFNDNERLVEKKLVNVGSDPFVNLANQNTVGLETDMHAFLQPVGSQTEDLFGSFDRPCLHVETQTNTGTVDKMLMTQISPHLPQQTSSMVQVAIAQSPTSHIEEKKLNGNAYMNSIPQASVGLGTDINPLLQPVGSQTEDLFDSAFDRQCLHVETQTNTRHIEVFTGIPRNLQTPQPAILTSSQTLEANHAATEYLTNMETQTDPIDAWIEANFSDIQTQTYDLEGYLVATCSQTQTNI